MSHDASTPRLVYRGPANDQAETTEAKNADDLAQKLKDGWRLRRIDAKHAVEPEAGASISVPAQTVKVDPTVKPAPAKPASADAPAQHRAAVPAKDAKK